MDDGELGYIVGLVMGVIFGVSMSLWINNDQWEYNLIQRGLAQYCPDDGEFAFEGGCDND